MACARKYNSFSSYYDLNDLTSRPYRDPAQLKTRSLIVQHQINALHEAFPKLEKELILDILKAKQWNVSTTVDVLSQFSEDMARGGAGEEKFEVLGDVEDETFTLVSDSTLTSTDASSSTPESEWVVVSDEWEMLDGVGERVPTYLEMLKKNGSDKRSTCGGRMKKSSTNANTTGNMGSGQGCEPKLSSIRITPVYPEEDFSNDFYGRKSHGARKRRATFWHKSRRMKA